MKRRHFLAALAVGALGWRLPRLRQSARVEAFLSQMSLREKIGQLFLFSLDGTQYTDAMHRLIAERHAGGMALFSYNVSTPAALTELTNAMQRDALEYGMPVPLFIAADQEGGRVLRLQGDAFSPFPSPMGLGAADDLDLTTRVAAAIGEEMLACGLNMNFAPVLDVNTQPSNPVINVRSFGSDPVKVAQQGAAFIRGLQSAGVVATGKHFPGHGSTTADSHYDLPIVTLERGRLLDELAPFAEGIHADVGALMTAHVLYPALDAMTPATFSAPIMLDLLRGELGFGGVLISDALTMGAVSQARDNPIYVMRDALAAGVDMLTFGALPDGSPPSLTDQIQMLEMVVTLVESGLVAETRIEDSARKILNLKERFGLLDWRPLDASRTQERLKLSEHQALLTEAAQKSVTLFSDGGGILPLKKTDKIAVIYPAEFPQIGASLRWGVRDALELPYSLNGGSLSSLLSRIEDRRLICLTLDVMRYPAQISLVNALPLERTVVIAGQSPYDLLSFPQVQTYLMTYGYTSYTLEAARHILFGELTPRGKAPVSLLGT